MEELLGVVPLFIGMWTLDMGHKHEMAWEKMTETETYYIMKRNTVVLYSVRASRSSKVGMGEDEEDIEKKQRKTFGEEKDGRK